MKFQHGPSLRDQLGLRKRVSIVWTYFEKLNRVRVRCRLCRHEQNYQGTTGNILRHLKNKHNIDCTVRGRQMHNLEVEVLDDAFQDAHNGHPQVLQEHVSGVMSSSPQRAAKETHNSSGEESDVDPYAASNILYDTAKDSSTYEEKINIQQAAHEKSPEPHYIKSESSVEEDRLVAEIEYYREKAAYYRMQTNLAALQVKKIKYELDRDSALRKSVK